MDLHFKKISVGTVLAMACFFAFGLMTTGCDQRKPEPKVEAPSEQPPAPEDATQPQDK